MPAALLPGVAIAGEQLSVVTSASLEASSNPFLRAGGNDTSLAATLELNPLWAFKDEVTQIDLQGSARLSQYLDANSGTDAMAAANVAAVRRITEKWNLHGSAGYSTSTSGVRDLFNQTPGLPITALSPGPVAGGAASAPSVAILPNALFVPIDATAAGRQTRQTTYRAGIGAEFKASARDRVVFDVSVNRTLYNDPLLADYRTFNQIVQYMRSLSPRSTVNLAVSFLEVRYSDGSSAFIATPLAGATRYLSSTLKLELLGGVSYVRASPFGQPSSSTVTPSVRASLCGTYERSGFCADAERSQQPTAQGGVRATSSASLTYHNRLNRRDSVTLGVRFDRRDQDTRKLFAASTLLGVQAQGERTLNNRLGSLVSGSYASVWQQGVARRSEVRARIGITYRFGALR